MLIIIETEFGVGMGSLHYSIYFYMCLKFSKVKNICALWGTSLACTKQLVTLCKHQLGLSISLLLERITALRRANSQYSTDWHGSTGCGIISGLCRI